jgi:hypothetical protein
MVDPRILRRSTSVARAFEGAKEGDGPARLLSFRHPRLDRGSTFIWFAHANLLT